MKHAWKSFWGNYFNFSGRSTRSEYWFFMLDNILVAFVLGIIMGIGTGIDGGDGGVITFICSIPYYLYVIAIFIPSIALCIRRLHDAGKSGWWYLWCFLLSFICGIGGILMLVFCCTDSVPDNQWGPNPKGMMYNNPYAGNPYGGQPYGGQPYNQNPYQGQQPYNGQQYNGYNNNNQNGPY